MMAVSGEQLVRIALILACGLNNSKTGAETEEGRDEACSEQADEMMEQWMESYYEQLSSMGDNPDDFVGVSRTDDEDEDENDYADDRESWFDPDTPWTQLVKKRDAKACNIVLTYQWLKVARMFPHREII